MFQESLYHKPAEASNPQTFSNNASLEVPCVPEYLVYVADIHAHA